MKDKKPLSAIAERVEELRSRYSAKDASLATLLCDERDPDRLAFRIVNAELDAVDLTYGELKRESQRFAAALNWLGVQPGDRVATVMGKSREYLIALMGIWRLGAVHVPLFTAFAPPQIAFRLEGSKAKITLCDEKQAPKLASSGESSPAQSSLIITTGEPAQGQYNFKSLLAAQAADFDAFVGGPDHPLIQLYTSGTTGTPKGVVMPVRSLASFQAYMEFSLDIQEDDVFWSAADPGWAYGLFTTIFGTLTTAAHGLLLSSGFSPETTYGMLSKFGVTNFAAAPTVYRALKASDATVPKGLSLRCASSAGEPLTPDVNLWAERALGVTVHDHYGQTEMGMMVGNHHHPALKQTIKTGSMGVSTPGFTAGVLKPDTNEVALPNETGRLAIDLHNSPLAWFSGYEDLPEKTSEKFSEDKRWYITGDVAAMDEDGFVHFSSRDDDVIIMAGYRIGPFEVESTLSKHPSIVESAAVARPDEVKGEVLEVFAVLNNDYSPSEELTAELQNFVKKNFAAHAYPRRIHYVEELPKTPSGKVQRFLLRKQLQSGAA